jgi:uncharacterized phage infection (PIP) family protein YhgE
MSVEQISNFQLAETMAYAEKPYMDIAVSEDVSEFEKTRLLELATYAGYTAGKQYTDSLDISVEQFAPEPSPEASELAVIRTERSEELDQRLNTNFEEVVINLDFKMGARTRNALARYGIATTRDVLVLGKEGVRQVPGLGDVGIDEIQDVITRVHGDKEVWKDQPTVEDIAKICTGLDQVTSRLVLGEVVSYDITTIQQILRLSFSELLKQIKESRYGYSYSGGQVNQLANDITDQAREVASRFNEAKTQAS